MKCIEIRPKLPAYLHQTLPPLERTSVEAHLIECNECRKILQSYTSVQNQTDLLLNQRNGTQASTKNKNVVTKKSGFIPKPSFGKHTDVQSKLQAAGLIVPSPILKQKGLHDTETQLENFDQEKPTILEDPSSKNTSLSGEELLRTKMLVMLAEEAEKLQQETLLQKEQNDVIERFSKIEIDDTSNPNLVIENEEEPEFIWSREMSLEAAMGGVNSEENPEEQPLERTTELLEDIPVSTFLNSSAPRWQEDPEQYVEIPYIHPVTQSEVLKKVRRNSMEGILFLESEEQKKQEEIARNAPAVVSVSDSLEAEIVPPLAVVAKDKITVQQESFEPTAASVAKERLYRQWGDLAPLEQNSQKMRIVNQGEKTLPFRENLKKQAVLYRFLAVVLLVAVLLLAFSIWKKQTELNAIAPQIAVEFCMKEIPYEI